MYIINKYVDWLLAGGLSVILYALVRLLKIDLFTTYNIANVAFILAYVINHPHFTSSYVFFYKEGRDLIRTSTWHFIVGVIVPFVLFGTMLLAFIYSNAFIFTVIVNIMFFVVGFHYVRQTYGVALLSLAKQKIYLSSKEKWALNLSMYPLWFVSFLNGHHATFQANFYGIPYMSYALPSQLGTVNDVLFYVSILVWVALIAKLYKTHTRVPLAFVASLASIVIWHFPSFYNFGFAYLIPMFHSLQYLLIVSAVKKNQVKQTVKRKFWVPVWVGYSFLVVMLGYLFFHLIPETLDKHVTYDMTTLGSTAILGAFLLFINIHHYAMDALLWRKGSRISKFV